MSGALPRRTIALVAIALAWLACEAEPPSIGQSASHTLESKDPRFRLVLERSSGPSTPSSDAEREIRLSVMPKKGWHIEPDAPTTLRLSAPEGIAVAAPSQNGEDAIVLSEQRTEFAIAWRVAQDRTAEAAAGPGSAAGPVEEETKRAHVEGRLKFGVCREGDPRCEIVRRTLDIPLSW